MDMAGGALDDADLAAVNLARKATDGEQIHVPALGEGGGTGGEGTSIAQAGPAAAGKVNLNQATAEQLDALPRIGPSTAAKIVAEREANGPFASVDDLERVSGIGAKTVDGLRDLATV